MISRRGLITGLISLAAAPAIVRASSLMPIKVIDDWLDYEGYDLVAVHPSTYADLVTVTRKAFLPRLYVQLWTPSSLLQVYPDGR